MILSNKINKFLIEFVDNNKNNFYFKHSLGSINYLNLIHILQGYWKFLKRSNEVPFLIYHKHWFKTVDGICIHLLSM